MHTSLKAASNVKQAVPFFMVSNIEESLRFYVDGLAFVKSKQWEPEGKIEWCWLEIGDAALMLQEYRKGRRPEAKLGQGVSICFTCEDAIALYREFESRGVDATRPFVGNAMWVTSVTDPDGYRLYFESPADVPEETVLDSD
jgi:lactoylglutathione lyase